MDTSYRFVAVFSIATVLSVLYQVPQPTDAAAVVRRRDTAVTAAGSLSNAGWKHPCGEETEATTDPDEPEDSDSDESNVRSFNDLSRRATALKAAIISLKTAYVAARFNNDASSAEASLDLNSPNSSAPRWNLTDATDNEILKLCYGNLARLAVLTNLTRLGEAASDMTPNFAERFVDLETQSYRGLYVIMCELNTVMNRLGVTPMSAETEAAIEAISIPTPPSEAVRHLNDYHVLRFLEISAEKLTEIFDRFARQTTSS